MYLFNRLRRHIMNTIAEQERDYDTLFITEEKQSEVEQIERERTERFEKYWRRVYDMDEQDLY